MNAFTSDDRHLSQNALQHQGKAPLERPHIRAGKGTVTLKLWRQNTVKTKWLAIRAWKGTVTLKLYGGKHKSIQSGIYPCPKGHGDIEAPLRSVRAAFMSYYPCPEGHGDIVRWRSLEC